MNEKHLRLCSSAEWAETISTRLMPWVGAQPDLGDNVLEVGPGPGITTDGLRQRVKRLTAVEADASLAEQLAQRLVGTNVIVLCADATDLPFEDGTFSGAASFTMLHHVPSVELQDRLLAQLARVLRPGGVLVGMDSLDSPAFRELHEDDICVPLDPDTLEGRLRKAGFGEVTLTVDISLRFVARR